jgi:hypothetical protein
LAQPPDITETFVREVDENLRRDQARDFFKTYGNWLIAGVVLLLAISGGLIWWNQHQTQRRGEQVEQLAQVYKDIGSGNVNKAGPQLDNLSQSGSKAIRASAEFTRAALALQQNDTKQAEATYKDIAEDSGLPRPYRDAALVRQTALEFDSLKPDDVIARLAPLTKSGEPWFGTAGEMTALAMLKQGKNQQAAQLFAAIAKDKNAPETIRARASQVAGSLGIDVGAALQTQAQ